MKEVEITTKINESIGECEKKLNKQNFKIIRRSQVDDIYMTQNLKQLSINNIDDILKTCVLIRYLNANGKEYKKITYKNKTYDGKNIISEKKTSVNCDDLNKAKELFEALEFEELVRVKYDVIVFSDGKREFAFQDVENIGLLLEYESNKNLDDYSDSEILEEKKNMLNEIKIMGLNTTEDLDYKKAFNIIKKRMLET